MVQPPTYTSWKITCKSPGDARALQHWLSDRIKLDRVFTDTVRAIPNGVESVQNFQHMLGDYFTDIRLLPEPANGSKSFRLVFQKRPDAGRFWKDLMVNILQEIEATPQKASIDLDSKREMEPVALGKETRPIEGKNMETYVLCKQYPEIGPGAVTFVCGPDPRFPTFDSTPGPAARFATVEDAIAFRSLMGHQLGGTDKYRVHELLPDGRVVDAEP